jgi:hypothetical protein
MIAATTQLSAVPMVRQFGIAVGIVSDGAGENASGRLGDKVLMIVLL